MDTPYNPRNSIRFEDKVRPEKKLSFLVHKNLLPFEKESMNGYITFKFELAT